MNDNVPIFLLQAAAISLSGVLAPGPVTAATLAAGVRRRHAGGLIAVGHGIVELPLMVLIMAGMGVLFEREGVRIAIGLLGGAFLVLMGIQMLTCRPRPARRSPSKPLDPGAGPAGRYPVWTGVVLSAGNPYFLLWWATVGLALATQAMSLGVLAFALFAIIHWLCDLIWLEALSLAAHRGARRIGERRQRIVLIVCAAVLLGFGAKFIWDAAKNWL